MALSKAGRYTHENEKLEKAAAKAAEMAAAAPAEVPEGELPPPPPASAPKAEHVEHVEYVADALGGPAEEAGAMRKADLVELARQAAKAPEG